MGLRRRQSPRQDRSSCALSGVEKRCHTRTTAENSLQFVQAQAASGGATSSNGSSSGSSSCSDSAGSNSQMVHNLALEANLGGMDLIKLASRAHPWHWNNSDKSHECVVSDDKLEVCFHPECSESAAAIRGSEPLVVNGNHYYWEVTVFDKTYGTSVMFGLCTKDQKLHANDYCNLVGLDKNGWSLSHKGLIWHNGLLAQYSEPFPPKKTVTVGLLFNTMRGELSYYLDGKYLGVAFYGLNNVNNELYPVIGSTAKCTRIRLTESYRGCISLLERSCFTLLKSARDKNELSIHLKQQRVPNNLIKYVCGSQTKITAKTNQYYWNVNNHYQAPSINDC